MENRNRNFQFLRACRCGQIEKASIIFSNIIDYKRESPFEIHPRRKSLSPREIVQDEFMNINFNNAFYLACEHGRVNILEWLIQKSERKYIDFREGFYHACKNNKRNVVDFLIEHFDLGELLTSNAFVLCIRYSHKDLFDYLYECDSSMIDIYCYREIILSGNVYFLKKFRDINDAIIIECCNDLILNSHITRFLRTIKYIKQTKQYLIDDIINLLGWYIVFKHRKLFAFYVKNANDIQLSHFLFNCMRHVDDTKNIIDTIAKNRDISIIFKYIYYNYNYLVILNKHMFIDNLELNEIRDLIQAENMFTHLAINRYQREKLLFGKFINATREKERINRKLFDINAINIIFKDYI